MAHINIVILLLNDFIRSWYVFPNVFNICIPVTMIETSKFLFALAILISDFSFPKSALVEVKKTIRFLLNVIFFNLCINFN